MDEKHMQLLKDWNAKHRVSLEVDSIMADVLTPIIKIFNRRHGTNYTLDGVNGTPRWSTANIHADEFLPNYYIPAWQNHHREIPVLVDRGLLSGAHRHYKIDIVSSRSDATVEPLKLWLSENGIGFRKRLVTEPGLDKCALDYRLYIDDDSKLAEKVENAQANWKGTSKTMLLVDMFNNREVRDS